MENAILNRKDYTILGKLLCKQKPDIAAELCGQLKGETDLEKLRVYFSKFCDINRLSNPLTPESRRLFVSTILQIYRPHTRRLSVSLANLLKMDKGNFKKLMDESDLHYRVYPEFKADADLLVTKMKED